MSKILLVEDHPDYSLIMKLELGRRGASVVAVSDGEKAIESCSESEYNLCILDFNLPGKNGFELAASLKAQNPKIKIAIVTAHSATDLRPKSKGLDISIIIQKPLVNGDYDRLVGMTI